MDPIKEAMIRREDSEGPLCELCGEPMPEGEPFRYHGFSGPCPKPPLPSPKDNVVVHAGVSNNLYPQGPTFHWCNGWMFARGEGMAVHIWKNDSNKPPCINITIPDIEWDSIVGFLSYPKAPSTPPSAPKDVEYAADGDDRRLFEANVARARADCGVYAFRVSREHYLWLADQIAGK